MKSVQDCRNYTNAKQGTLMSDCKSDFNNSAHFSIYLGARRTQTKKENTSPFSVFFSVSCNIHDLFLYLTAFIIFDTSHFHSFNTFFVLNKSNHVIVCNGVNATRKRPASVWTSFIYFTICKDVITDWLVN